MVTYMIDISKFFLTELSSELSSIKRLTDKDSESDGKIKELERQMKSVSQEKENLGRVSGIPFFFQHFLCHFLLYIL